MQKLQIESLSTLLSIVIDTSLSCNREFFEIQQWLTDFEHRFSRFQKDNWLWNINTTGKWILDEDGKNMLHFALALAETTDGYFDPTVTGALEAIGYGKKEILAENSLEKISQKKKRVINWIQPSYWIWCDNKALHPILKHGTFRDVEIQDYNCILHNGSRIEFGWVGKWYALDIIASKLSWFERYYINFWGDIYWKGGWTLWLEDPQDEEKAIWTLRLENGFFCASSWGKRKIGDAHHLLDARTGKSTFHTLGTYIEGSSWMLADALATATFILPIDSALELLETVCSPDWWKKYEASSWNPSFSLPIKAEGGILSDNRSFYRSKWSSIILL